MQVKQNETLDFHLKEVLAGRRRFENAAQSIWRMIESRGVEKVLRGGKSTYDFIFFREGREHIVGWYDELNEFVSFAKDAAEGGPSKRLAFVFIGQPGNGKTFAMTYLCNRYKGFLGLPQNRRYQIEFINLGKLGKYGGIEFIQSQTFEDPMIIAMNMFESQDECKEYIAKAGFSDKIIDKLYQNYRPIAPCSWYIWKDIREYCDDDIEKMLGSLRIIPVPIAENLATITGKYAAGDKITSSATELRGEEETVRLLHLKDTSHPYKYNIRAGALGQSAGGGIHFADELFKMKPDLINIYLQVINDRNIELVGNKWPMDTFIVATSNNEEYNKFISEVGQGPIRDRCKTCFIPHNTDYKLQSELTRYVLGWEPKTTFMGEKMHEDPNLDYALSVLFTLTRLPPHNKLTPIEMMKLEAGENAGEKHIDDLLEVKKECNSNPDVNKHFGHTGLGHRSLIRTAQAMLAMAETQEGKCRFALDCFSAAEREILELPDAVLRDKCMKDMAIARRLYRRRVRTSIFNAYRNDPDAIKKDVMNYINMIIALDSGQLGQDKTWHYMDPQTKEMKPLKIDETFVKAVEARIGHTTEESRKTFRNSIRNSYVVRRTVDPGWDFMDNETLVKAVTDVKLKSDVAGASSLAGALANRTNEENKKVYSNIFGVMLNKLGYCETCSPETMEYFIEPIDED